MNFLLIDKQRLSNAIAHIIKLPIDGKTEIVIQEYKKNRSKAQNRLYWNYVKVLGDHFGYDKDEMHDELKYAFLGEESYTNRKGVERVKPKSSAKLTTKEMVKYLTKIEVLAGNQDVKLPIPDDINFIMMRN